MAVRSEIGPNLGSTYSRDHASHRTLVSAFSFDSGKVSHDALETYRPTLLWVEMPLQMQSSYL